MTHEQNAATGAPGAAAQRLAQLRLFTGTVRALVSIIASSLLTVIFPAWIGSSVAFLAVAACVNLFVDLPALWFEIEPSTVYTFYLVLGIVAGTLLALGLALERSIPAVQRHLDEIATRMGQVLSQGIGWEGGLSAQELAGRLEPVMQELNRRTAGLRRLTPAGALTRFLIRQFAPELEALGQVSSSARLDPSRSAVDVISTHAAAAAGAQLAAHARRIRIVMVIVWVLMFAVSALPLLFLRQR